MHEIITLQFTFEFGIIDDREMSVKVVVGENILFATANNPVVNLKVNLPSKISLEFFGKHNGKDTYVDNDGNIVKDVYVKIVGIKLDNLNVPKWVLDKKLSYITEKGETLKTSYIGFNGIMTFDMPETNIFSLYRRLNKDE